jgi:hypothetical protein
MPHLQGYGPDGLCLEAWWGEIGSSELLAHEKHHLAVAKPSLPPRAIVDLTRARFDLSVGKRQIEELTELYLQHQNIVAGARVAIVVGSDIDKVRLYEKYARERSLNVVVFNTIEVACVWLGADAAQVREWMREAPIRATAHVSELDVADRNHSQGRAF